MTLPCGPGARTRGSRHGGCAFYQMVRPPGPVRPALTPGDVSALRAEPPARARGPTVSDRDTGVGGPHGQGSSAHREHRKAGAPSGAADTALLQQLRAGLPSGARSRTPGFPPRKACAPPGAPQPAHPPREGGPSPPSVGLPRVLSMVAGLEPRQDRAHEGVHSTPLSHLPGRSRVFSEKQIKIKIKRKDSINSNRRVGCHSGRDTAGGSGGAGGRGRPAPHLPCGCGEGGGPAGCPPESPRKRGAGTRSPAACAKRGSPATPRGVDPSLPGGACSAARRVPAPRRRGRGLRSPGGVASGQTAAQDQPPAQFARARQSSTSRHGVRPPEVTRGLEHHPRTSGSAADWRMRLGNPAPDLRRRLRTWWKRNWEARFSPQWQTPPLLRRPRPRWID